MKRVCRLCCTLVMVALLTIGAAPAMPSAASSEPSAAFDEEPSPDTSSSTGGVLFVENAGQWDEGARFQVWGGGVGTTWLAEDAQWISVVEPAEETSQVDRLEAMADPARVAEEDAERAAVNLRLSFVDANPDPVMEPLGAVETNVSYFIGADADGWQVGVPIWSSVRYVDCYPDVNMEGIISANGRMSAV